MRVAILCNDRLGIPAIQQLLQHKIIVSIATSNRVSEISTLLKQISDSGNIPFQIFNKKNLETDILTWLGKFQPDVVLVKTFPWKIPSVALKIPKYGFINFHYAPLPEFRGTNPLFWMIKAQVSEGGVTVHKMDENFDSGDILFMKKVPIYPDASFGMLIGQLAFVGAELVIPLLNGLMQNNLSVTKQNGELANWYARPKAEDLTIHWRTMNSWAIRALIKACNPWQKGAVTKFKGWTFGITDASLSFANIPEGTAAGTIVEIDEQKGLLVACCDGKAIRADVIYTEEGYFPGYKMTQFGLRKGNLLGAE